MGLAVGKESRDAPSSYTGILKVKHGMMPTTSHGKFNNSTNYVSKCEGFFLALLCMCVLVIAKGLVPRTWETRSKNCTACSSLSDSGMASNIINPILFLNCKAAGLLVLNGIRGIEDFVQAWLKHPYICTV